MTDKITMMDTYKYRIGRPARVLCVDAAGEFPVIALSEDGAVTTHKADGSFFATGEEGRFDLIKVEPPVECWVNYYAISKECGFVFKNKSEAEESASSTRTHLIKLTIHGDTVQAEFVK